MERNRFFILGTCVAGFIYSIAAAIYLYSPEGSLAAVFLPLSTVGTLSLYYFYLYFLRKKNRDKE
ncbi:hypothetical protein V1502_19005 [Bacillus sp. SCS-153A]|uniref:hypothetical protein n=1 Tax=Rossellomorea sedimentorum TaxID=3115294 RepID=UPI0039065FFE